MTSTTAESFDYATQQVGIYINIFNVVFGIPGALLNIIVFLSLKSFRDNTCANYLTAMSIADIGLLICGPLIRFLVSTINVDWTATSVFFCKFRSFLLNYSSLIIFTFLCLATIDHYLVTNIRPQWQQYSNIKVVRRSITITAIFWAIFSILYLVFYDIAISSITGKRSCTITNVVFDRYNTNFHRPVIMGFLPNILTGVFTFLAHRNIKNIAYRAVPLVRRELDKQLTKMLIIQVIYNLFALLFFNLTSIIVPYVSNPNDSILVAKLQFVQMLSYSIYYTYFSVNIKFIQIIFL